MPGTTTLAWCDNGYLARQHPPGTRSAIGRKLRKKTRKKNRKKKSQKKPWRKDLKKKPCMTSSPEIDIDK
jgi:hypothetical protein